MPAPPPLPIAGTPRLAPGRSFPPYRFVPGRHPHPTADPAGHSYGRPADGTPPPDESSWSSHAEYLHACDLYNHGWFWEAHEAWEDQWRRTPRGRRERLVLQGLIQVAAAHLKAGIGAEAGACRLSRRGTEKLRRAARAGAPDGLGVPLDRFAAEVEAWFDGESARWPVLSPARE